MQWKSNEPAFLVGNPERDDHGIAGYGEPGGELYAWPVKHELRRYTGNPKFLVQRHKSMQIDARAIGEIGASMHYREVSRLDRNEL